MTTRRGRLRPAISTQSESSRQSHHPSLQKAHLLTRHPHNYSALKYRGPGSQSAPSSQQPLAHRPGNSNGKKQSSVSERLAAKRAAALEPVRANPNRARPAGMPVSYTIAPISQLGSGSGPEHRPVGAGSMEAFRKITQGKKRN